MYKYTKNRKEKGKLCTPEWAGEDETKKVHTSHRPSLFLAELTAIGQAGF